MSWKYNSPPSWPAPPNADWRPPEGWQADPSWGPAPEDWAFWVEDEPTPSVETTVGPARGAWFGRHKVLTGLGAVLLLAGFAAAASGNETGTKVAASSPTGSSTSSETTVLSTPPPSIAPTSASPVAVAPPAPAPSKTTQPKPPPPTVYKYSGRGNKILSIKKPEAGAALISFSHKGTSNFIVMQLDAALTETENLVNEIGPYSGKTILDLEDGSETLKLKITADGTWTVVIKALSETRELEGLQGSGRADDVLLYFGSAGVATLTHKGTSNFIVTYYNEDGGENLVNEIGRYTGESVLPAGPGFLQIKADGAWTIKVAP